MQKKVLAAAIGGLLLAPAAYAADVNISGRIAVGVENYDVDAPGADAEMLVSDQSSSIIFTGSEDLGGGLSAWFKIDNRFSPPDGTFAASGNTQVGLQGDWGKLAIGRADLHYNEMFRFEGLASASLQTRVTGSVWSQVAGIPIANGTRTTNAIVWDGAFGDITARIGYSTSGEENDEGSLSDEGEAITGALRWSGGPLSVGASIWSAESDTAPTTETESTRAWVGYEFGAFTIGAGWDVSSITAGGVETERTSFAIPIKFNPGGANSFSIAFATADDLEVGGTDVSDSGATIMSVGWDHALSKRTHVGVYYTDLDNDDNGTYNFFANTLSGTPPGTVAAGTDANQLYVGIAHFY